jgi:hypothetical protein
MAKHVNAKKWVMQNCAFEELAIDVTGEIQYK